MHTTVCASHLGRALPLVALIALFLVKPAPLYILMICSAATVTASRGYYFEITTQLLQGQAYGGQLLLKCTYFLARCEKHATQYVGWLLYIYSEHQLK